jgi:hypothetical protein
VKAVSLALACVLSTSSLPSTAVAAPVKHWKAFPGREVRAIALRGDLLGGESSFTAVQGRDGYVYLRGRRGLYRMLDVDGRYERVADTSECSGWFESQGTDLRSRVPRAICTRAAEIILAGARDHGHIRTPVPTWPGALRTVGQYRIDQRYLTAVLPAASGGYWFVYGYPGGLGRIRPSGRAELRHITALGRIRSVAALGEDVYAMDDECRVAHLRGLVVLAIDVFDRRCARPYWPTDRIVAGADGAAWLIGDGIVERRRPVGRWYRWKIPMTARDVAVSRDGTGYVVGVAPSDRSGRAMLAVLAPGRPPLVRVLPEYDVGSIAIDGRGRTWLSVPYWHAAVLISPGA